jgi:hypothetical protein
MADRNESMPQRLDSLYYASKAAAPAHGIDRRVDQLSNERRSARPYVLPIHVRQALACRSFGDKQFSLSDKPIAVWAFKVILSGRRSQRTAPFGR